jgi:hypothetical protein
MDYLSKYLKYKNKYLKLRQQLGGAEIDDIASRLEFKQKRKQPIEYRRVNLTANLDQMPANSYAVNNTGTNINVVTRIAGKQETTNVAKPDDIIMCGPLNEKYVVAGAKFRNLYLESKPNIVIPEQSPRIVARYFGPPVNFTAPWGAAMILEDGDYLVRELLSNGAHGYYRIEQGAYESTYEAF